MVPLATAIELLQRRGHNVFLKVIADFHRVPIAVKTGPAMGGSTLNSFKAACRIREKLAGPDHCTLSGVSPTLGRAACPSRRVTLARRT
jgi:hypothetical protein